MISRGDAKPTRPLIRVVQLGPAALFAAGVAYLVFKTCEVAGQAGFDFRHLWLAGTLWTQGLNPYALDYQGLGREIITAGHVPTLWPYPPNWIVPSVLLAQTDLTRSAVIFNVINIAALLATSALLTAALPWTPAHRGTEGDRPGPHLLGPGSVFLLHAGAMATLQATAVTLSTGQTSILAYLGLGLLLYGLAREQRTMPVIGLTVLLLKPQLGAIFVAVLLMDRRHWGLVLKAGAVSALLSLPAFLVSPGAAFDWVSNLRLYDGMNMANAPPAMTGVRNLAFDLLHRDIGNIAAVALAMAVAVGLCATRSGTKSGTARTLDALLLAAAVAIALAPLHTYDLVLIGAPLFALARGGRLEQALGVAAAASIWRADDLAAFTGFYNHAAQFFHGSRIATLGALLLLVAVYRCLKQPQPVRLG